MAAQKRILIPDIGGFDEVEIIDILVQPGDSIKPEDPLLTLESDKATMDIPSPDTGTVTKVLVKVGDKVSEGTPILEIEAEPAKQKPAEKTKAAPEAGSPSPPLRAPPRDGGARRERPGRDGGRRFPPPEPVREPALPVSPVPFPPVFVRPVSVLPPPPLSPVWACPRRPCHRP